MIYAPHFQLRAFERLTDHAKFAALTHLLEALVAVNVVWLREHPSAPWLYQSGVRYKDEPPGQDDWQDIPETLARGNGDCEDLACWRLAELRTRTSEDVLPHVTRTILGPRTVYHIAVRRRTGGIEDPSRVLGMR